MPISITCPKCSSNLRVPDDLAGKKVKCPKCTAVFPVAAPEQAAITKEKPPARSEGIAQTITTLEEIDDDDEEEEEEAPKSRKMARKIRRDPTEEAVSTIIPYKNGRALIAYYLGIFSLIPCAGLLLGPAALLLGILGLRYVNANPTAKGTGHAIAGIVLGGLTTLGNWGLGIVLAIAAIVSR
jgi:predicted Zn finger-like uncharacterized protein